MKQLTIITLLFLLLSCRPITPPPSPLAAPQALYLSYAPLVGNAAHTDACGHSIPARQLALLFITDVAQKRLYPHCDNRLVKAAMHRAQDMATTNYFSHMSPSGETPNSVVLQFGCVLPDYYNLEGNQIESIGLNYASAQQMWDGWKDSPGHRVHVLGEVDFYAEQTSYGIGYAEGNDSRYWVLLTTPGCG